jgi:23S rRNA (adenine2503-C2)-methyltransferase
MRRGKIAQKCVILTKSRYAENLSKFFRRQGYRTQVLKDERHLQLVAFQENFSPSVMVADEESLSPENLGIIIGLKEKKPRADIFVIASHGRIPWLREAAKEGLIEFITGPRPSFDYFWSMIQRREQRRPDPAFRRLSCDSLKVVARAVSPGAEKFVFALTDNQLIEAVALKLLYRQVKHVICVSVQVGCAIGCKFCATGRIKFGRNLTAEEILGQVWKVLGKSNIGQEVLNGKKPFHITYMGEGEAMINYAEVARATKILRQTFGERISFTISTVGILSGMRKLLKERFGSWVTLQISLHAPNEAQRKRLIPAGSNLKEVIALARKYSEQTGQRVCVNYVLIRGQNDTQRHAEQLAELIDPQHFYVKLSQLSPIEKTSFKPSSGVRRKKFRKILEERGYLVKYFVSKGQLIGSGCGQMIGDTV